MLDRDEVPGESEALDCGAAIILPGLPFTERRYEKNTNI